MAMLFKTPPSLNLEICVIVPVKDEEELIWRCLEALRLQKNEFGSPICTKKFEVLILANNCQDKTVEWIRHYQHLYPSFPLYVEEITFPPEKANIGNARRLLMDVAWDRFESIEKPEGIIASTDGDTTVDNQWISEIIKEAKSGSEVIGGKIITEVDDCPARTYYLKDIRYQNLIAKLESLIDPQIWNPWPSHFHCYGASFAIKSTIYNQAGRIPPLAYLEDVAFLKILESMDAKIRKTPKVKVYTSSRKMGRVERGLSQQLAWFESLGEEKQERWVECAESIYARIKLKKALRNLWDGKNTNLMLDESGEPFGLYLLPNLSLWINESKHFGELWNLALNELNRNNWFEQWGPVKIDEAIEKLIGYVLDIERPFKKIKSFPDIQRKPLPFLKNDQS